MSKTIYESVVLSEIVLEPFPDSYKFDYLGLQKHVQKRHPRDTIKIEWLQVKITTEVIEVANFRLLFFNSFCSNISLKVTFRKRGGGGLGKRQNDVIKDKINLWVFPNLNLNLMVSQSEQRYPVIWHNCEQNKRDIFLQSSCCKS